MSLLLSDLQRNTHEQFPAAQPSRSHSRCCQALGNLQCSVLRAGAVGGSWILSRHLVCLNLCQTSPGACSACVTSVTANGCLTKLILASWELQLSSSCCLEGICHSTRALRTPQSCLLPSALLALQASPKARNMFGEDWGL